MTLNATQRVALSIGMMIMKSEELADQLAAAQARIAELEKESSDGT